MAVMQGISSVKVFNSAGLRINVDAKASVRTLGDVLQEIGNKSQNLAPDATRIPSGGANMRLQALVRPDQAERKGFDRNRQYAIEEKNRVVGALSERVDALVHERNSLLPYLGNPTTSAAARAKIGMIDLQIAQESKVRDRVASVAIPANLSIDQSKVMIRSFAALEGKLKELTVGDPRTQAYAKGEIVRLFGRLANPSPVDSKTLTNQVNLVTTLSFRIQDLKSAQNDLAAYLQNSKQAAAARAKIALLGTQISELSRINERLADFKIPASLDDQTDHVKATVIYQLYEASNDLTDPSKRAAAQRRIEQLFGQLQGN